MKARAVLDSGWVRRVGYGVLSAGVTAGVFGYLFSRVSVGAVLDAIRAADPAYLALFVALSFAMNVFRTWRYGLALAVGGWRPGAVSLFLVVLVRNLFSDLLPARLGSLIYVWLLTRRLGVPLGATASSFALAFLFDTMAIAPLVVLAVVWVGGGTRLPAGVLAAAGGLLLAGVGAALHWMPAAVQWVARAVRRLPAVGSARRERWSRAVEQIRRDVVASREAGVYARLFVLSVGVRIGKYGALYALMLALLAPLGYHADDVGAAKVFLGVCSSELAASLPISGLAGFGAYEGTWAAVFGLLGFPGDVAKITGLSHHLVTQVYGYALGGIALALLLLPWFRVRSALPQPPSNGGRLAVFYAKLAVAMLCLGVLVSGAWLAAPRRRDVAPADRPPGAEAWTPSGGVGRVVFDSDRGGTFGLYSMRPDGSDVRPLVDGPLAEIYPDPSPDGRWIVYAKAGSAGKGAESEVWLCRRDGSSPRRLAENGTFPTFSADGQTVYFERDRRRVMAVGADGKGEREIFPAGHEGFAGRALVKPRISPDGRWVAAVSDKGGRWNTWAVELASGRAVHVGAGCEPAWFPDSRRIAWVRERGARQGTGIFVFDRETATARELQDAGPPLGHEYFPTVSRDGRYLLWGACPEGQHAHDDSAYQVFIRELDSGRFARLTVDGADNRWPKILPDVEAKRVQ